MDRFLQHVGVLGMKWGRRKSLQARQKDWDKKASKNYLKAYNKAADYANTTLIPKINKKYAGVNFSKLRFDTTGRPIGSSKLAKTYDKYMNEYQKSFLKVFDMNMSELIGERPKE